MKFKKSLLGSMVSMVVTSGLVSTGVSAQEVFTANKPQLKQAGQQVEAKKSSGIFIVQVKGEPGIAHAENIGELVSSNQLVTQGNNKYNAHSKKMQAYTARMKDKQKEVVRAIGNVDVLHNYVHTFNGFSAKLTPNQVAKLKNNPDVVAVWEDEMQTVSTANTPEFLGLTGPGGQHTLGIKGEDVIIGILDTGITPEHPSFADVDGNGVLYDAPPARWGGTCDAGEETDAGTFTCNNKLIGARYYKSSFESVYPIRTELGEFISPRDADGHGNHTAGTAGGNEAVPGNSDGLSTGDVSGIAPRARIAAYKVCWNSDYENPETGVKERGCFFGDSMAAIDQAIADGVDVLNYSIGNGTDYTGPVNAASLRANQAGVFFTGSAGNSGPTPGSVRNNAPWIMSVGASTYDGVNPVLGKEVQVNTGDMAGQSLFSLPGAITASIPEAGFTGDVAVAEPALACDPITNPSEITGKIALIARGACSFSVKILNAQDAGAQAVIVYTDDRNPTAMGGSDAGITIPGVMITNSDGMDLVTAVNNSATNVTLTNTDLEGQNVEVGNIMAGFSSRGAGVTTADIISPDITAPGVSVFAPYTSTPMFGEGKDFEYLSGTSMSGPHIAGMAALLTEQYPDWSPAQIKSALMTTAYQHVTKEDGLTPADPFDFGAGHADPVAAMTPGLTYDANFFDFMAFMCGLNEESFVAEQSGYTCSELVANGFSTDPSQLNYPSIAIGKLLTEETITRTLTDVSGVGGNYTVAVEGLESLNVSVATFDSDGVETESDNLVVDANGKASFALTLSKKEETVPNQWLFGAVVLTGQNGTVVRSPVAVNPAPDVNIVVPESISLDLNRGRANFPVEMLYSGRTSLEYAGLVAPTGIAGNVAQDPDQSFSFNEAGLSTHFFHIPEGTKVARFSLRDSLVAQPGTDLDLFVYRCTGWSCAPVDQSTNGGSNEDVILVNPEPRANIGGGDVYLVWVHGWDLAGAQTTDFTMPVWIADSADSSTRVISSRRAIEGRYNHVQIMARGLNADSLYMGAITFFNNDGEAEGTTVLEVQP